MNLSKPTIVAATAGLLLGWLSMGILWLANQPDDAQPDTTPVVVTTLPQGGSGATALPSGTSISDPRISFRQLGRLAEDATLIDPVDAVRNAEKIPGHDNREEYFGTALRTWGETDGETAAMWVLDEYQGEKLSDALYYVADGWAEAEPEAAGNWFLENTTGAILEDAVWEVLEAWGRKDPEAAMEWSEQLDDYTKAGILFGLAEGWGAVDPEGAAQAGMSMEGEIRYDFLTSVATQWAGSDPQALGNWATSLLSEELRAGVLAEMGESWAQIDPQAAAEWGAALESATDRYYLQSGIAVGWSDHDTSGAVEWAVNAITDPEDLNELLGDIVFNWTNLDPAGTSEWLNQQPTGTKKDTILEVFSETISGQDPMAAVAWANQISDPDKRIESLRTLARDWYEEEGVSSLDEMRKLGLPNDVIEDVRKN